VAAAVGVALLLAGSLGHRASGHPPTPSAAASARTAPRAAADTGGARGSQTRTQNAAVARLASYGLPLFCGGRSKRLVALTFDDGPGPYTRLAVAKLRRHDLRATFFLVGKQIRAYPGLAQLERSVAAFGDHTLTHPFLPSLPNAQMVEQIAGEQTLIEHVTARRVLLFRPPYEGRSPAVDREVRRLGMLDVLWNVDSADSLGANYAAIERNVVSGLRPGAIILMHENRGQTIRALLSIFAALARDHLQAVTIPELIERDPPSLAQLRAGGLGCATKLKPGSGG